MRCYGYAVVLALVFLAMAAGPIDAAQDVAASVSAPVLLGNWWDDVRNWFSAQASNRTRVVQFGLVGMLLALAILYTAGKRRR